MLCNCVGWRLTSACHNYCREGKGKKTPPASIRSEVGNLCAKAPLSWNWDGGWWWKRCCPLGWHQLTHSLEFSFCCPLIHPTTRGSVGYQVSSAKQGRPRETQGAGPQPWQCAGRGWKLVVQKGSPTWMARLFVYLQMPPKGKIKKH